MPYLDKEKKFYDYRTEEVTDNILFDINKCDYPDFKELLYKSDYMRAHKNLIGEIIYMKPAEYFEGCAEIFNERSDGSYSGNMELRQTSKDKIILNHLKDVILKYKKKFPMGYLDYADLGQEGRHRMYVAGELSGWNVSQPVFVVRWADEELQARRDKERQIRELEWKIEDAVKSSLRFTFSNIDDLQGQLQYELNKKFNVHFDDEDVKFDFTTDDITGEFVVSIDDAEVRFSYEDVTFEQSDEELLLDGDDSEDISDWLKKVLGESMNEILEKHSELNPKLWEKEMLKPNVKTAILNIVDKYIEDSEVLTPNDVIDVEIVGSNANYNYSKDSDLDVHIVVNMESISSDPAMAQIACDAERAIFNSSYDLKIKNTDVELYVEDVKSGANSNGVYSVTHDKWIKTPREVSIPDMSSNREYQMFLHNWKTRVEESLESNDTNIIQKCINELYNLRRVSLMSDGEFGIGNLIFKEIRNLGLLDEMKDRVNTLLSRKLSLEKLT